MDVEEIHADAATTAGIIAEELKQFRQRTGCSMELKQTHMFVGDDPMPVIELEYGVKILGGHSV